MHDNCYDKQSVKDREETDGSQLISSTCSQRQTYVTYLTTTRLFLIHKTRTINSKQSKKMPSSFTRARITGFTRKFFTNSFITSILTSTSKITNSTSGSSTANSTIMMTSTTMSQSTSFGAPTYTVPTSHVFLIVSLLILIALVLSGFGVRSVQNLK